MAYIQSKFWDNFKSLCNARHTTPTQMLDACGISSGNIGRWQKGGSATGEVLEIIARHMGVTIDYLVTGEYAIAEPNTEVQGITQDELLMIKAYRELPELQQEMIRDTIIQSAKKAVQKDGKKAELLA